MTFTPCQITLNGHSKEVYDRVIAASMDLRTLAHDENLPKVILSDAAFMWAKQDPHLASLIADKVVQSVSDHAHPFKITLRARDYYLVT